MVYAGPTRRGLRARGVSPPPPPSARYAEGRTAMTPDRTRRARRRFLRGGLALAVLGLLAGCGLARLPGREPKRVARVGLLHASSPQLTAPNLDAFRQGMDAQGYEEGRGYVLELRHAEGRNERLPDLAGELVRLRVDVILTGGIAAIGAARQATTTIPIVFAAAGAPVGAGLGSNERRRGSGHRRTT